MIDENAPQVVFPYLPKHSGLEAGYVTSGVKCFEWKEGFSTSFQHIGWTKYSSLQLKEVL